MKYFEMFTGIAGFSKGIERTYFEDDWADIGINEKGEEYRLSDTAKYRVFGNAVTTSKIEAIVSRMIEKGCLA